jgi:hypothetical protein
MIVCVLTLIAEPVAQRPSPKLAVTGLVRSEATIGGRTMAVAFVPALRADEDAHRGLLRKGNNGGTMRVQVARLESDGPLLFGSPPFDVEVPGAAPHDVWLARTDESWNLEIADTDQRGVPAVPPVIGSVRLSDRAARVPSPTFSAAVIPTSNDGGRLALRWGDHEWAASVRFGQREAAAEGRRSPTITADLSPDDLVAAIARSQTLSERNETALVLEDGSRLSVLFWRDLNADGRDFAGLASTADGAVVRMTAGAVTRLRTEVPLRFGDVVVGTGNVTAAFPGAYGLWLKRAGRGWRLLFNNEPDAWGTQHDPAFDAGEIDLAYSEAGLPAQPFGVALVPTAADRGRLVIQWGVHEWLAEFVTSGTAPSVRR